MGSRFDNKYLLQLMLFTVNRLARVSALLSEQESLSLILVNSLAFQLVELSCSLCVMLQAFLILGEFPLQTSNNHDGYSCQRAGSLIVECSLSVVG